MLELFISRNGKILRNPHFWAIIVIIFFLIFIYQFWPWREWAFPVGTWFWLRGLRYLNSLVVFEFTRHFVGVLFLLPIIYAAVIFQWRGVLVATFLSLIGVFPLVIGLWNNFDSLLSNICLLLLPTCLVLLLKIEIELRRKSSEYFAGLERERRIYLQKMLETQEGERRRIAQEIHDESIQALLAMASYTETIESDSEEDIGGIKRKAKQIKGTMLGTVEELRRICLALRPSVLDNLGLIAALRWIIEQTNREGNVSSQIIISGSNHNLSPQVEVTVFRVVQEAINNIKRHTQASKAIVKVQFDEESTKILIQDNGNGFVIPEKFSTFALRGKLGLIGIQQRIEALGGTFKIKSGLGEGTLLSIEVPS